MPSSTSTGRGGLDTVELVHASGATATVYLWGATLTSYCTAQREEMIFVSPGAVFDGTQPIRGGVPVVFPQFGRPDQRLPMHGFARTSMWSVDSIVDASEETSLLLSLSESAATLELWPHRFRLELRVRLSAASLTMSLVATNTGAAPFDFQALLHPYFRVEDVTGVVVRGLAGRSYVDKVDGGSLKILQAQDLTLPSFTDRVHVGPTDQRGAEKDVLILSRGPSRLGCLSPQPLRAVAATTNSARLMGEAVPCDVVVWNPHAAASPPDLPPPAYRHFVCVEPGLVAAHHALPAGGQALIGQKIVPAG